MKKFLLASAVALLAGSFAYADTTDVLTAESFGITAASRGYADFTADGATAKYAAQANGGQSFIQIRAANNNSGIVSTVSGGYITKVVLNWVTEGETTTPEGRTVEVYGSNTAYTLPSALYGDAAGVKLGTIVCGTSTELEVKGGYKYVGLRSADGALYLNSASLTWSDKAPEGGEVEPPVSDKTEVTTIAALKAIADQTEFVFKGKAYVSQAYGKYIFVQDATGAALLFGNDWTYKYGDCLTGFEGKRTDYNGVVEFTSISNETLGTPAEVAPKAIANATEAEANVDWYAKLSNVTVATAEGAGNPTITFADGSTLPTYNRFSIALADGTYETLYGVIGQYGTTVQFYNLGTEALKLGETPEPTVAEAKTIAELKAIPDQTVFKFKGKVYVSQAIGRYMFVQDATGAALLYGNDWTYKYGDCLTSFEGKRTDYNGVVEFTSITNEVLGTPAEVTPKEINNADEAKANVDWYVKMNDVTVSDNGATVTFANNSTLPTYNRFNTTLTDGEYAEIYGVIGQYGATVQFYYLGTEPLKLGETPNPPATTEGTLVVEKATNIQGTDTDTAIQPLESFEIDGFRFTFAAGETASASQNPAFWKADNTCRIYLGSTMTVTAPEGQTFKGLTWNCKSIKGVGEANPIVATPAGSFTYEAKTITWNAGEPVNTVTFVLPSEKDADGVNPNVQILSFDLVDYTQVEDLVESAAPAVYYDLNGRKVANPERGIYIVRQGSKTFKVLVK